jgi:hypothetical protein
MSRTTAYSSSATPRMISPSTKASAGACLQLDLDAAVLLLHLDVEVGIAHLRRARIVGIAAGVSTAARSGAAVVQAAAGASRRRAISWRDKEVETAARRDAAH